MLAIKKDKIQRKSREKSDYQLMESRGAAADNTFDEVLLLPKRFHKLYDFHRMLREHNQELKKLQSSANLDISTINKIYSEIQQLSEQFNLLSEEIDEYKLKEELQPIKTAYEILGLEKFESNPITIRNACFTSLENATYMNRRTIEEAIELITTPINKKMYDFLLSGNKKSAIHGLNKKYNDLCYDANNVELSGALSLIKEFERREKNYYQTPSLEARDACGDIYMKLQHFFTSKKIADLRKDLAIILGISQDEIAEARPPGIENWHKFDKELDRTLGIMKKFGIQCEEEISTFEQLAKLVTKTSDTIYDIKEKNWPNIALDARSKFIVQATDNFDDISSNSNWSLDSSSNSDSYFEQTDDSLSEQHNALKQTNQDDEIMLTGLMSKILSSHTEYLKRYRKSKFKPNETRREAIKRVEAKMNKIRKEKDLNPKEKMQLIVGLLETNKHIVLHHQKNTDLLAKYGMRGIKKTSRLASIYKKILDKSPNEYGIDVEKAVKKFNTTYPKESAAMVIKNKPSK